MGVSLFAGEAEGRLDGLLRDAANGTLQADLQLPERTCRRSSASPLPVPAARARQRTVRQLLDLRCRPRLSFQCSFCTIINVQGRKSRRRSPDDVEQHHPAELAQGIRRFFITDDNFARNKDWEAIFDRIIALRERERHRHQADHPGGHAVPPHSELHREGGARRRQPGLHRPGEHQSRQPARGQEAAEQDHRISQDAAGLEARRRHHLSPATSSVSRTTRRNRSARDIEIIKRELPIDILEFFCLTPLPGSEDHQMLWQKGDWMDPDMNKYDIEHAVRASSADEQGGMGAGLSRRLGSLLHARAHGDDPAPRGRHQWQHVSARWLVFLFCSSGSRWRTSIPCRAESCAASTGATAVPACRIEPIWSFYPKYAWNFLTKYSRAVRTPALAARHQSAHSEGPESICLHRPGDDAGRRGRDRAARAVHPQ